MYKNAILDALIPREVFNTQDKSNEAIEVNAKTTISLSDLEKDSLFYSSLRKPECQRKINMWKAEQKIGLIKSFLQGQHIPVVTLWRAPDNYVFVIDGSHRLSALISWVNDDYGDGEISKMNCDGDISEAQLKIAAVTREMINNEIGTYKEYKYASNESDEVSKDIIGISKKLASLGLEIHWIQGGFVKTRDSFFKTHYNKPYISDNGCEDNNQNMPVSRSGKGHNYWSSYKEN